MFRSQLTTYLNWIWNGKYFSVKHFMWVFIFIFLSAQGSPASQTIHFYQGDKWKIEYNVFCASRYSMWRKFYNPNNGINMPFIDEKHSFKLDISTFCTLITWSFAHQIFKKRHDKMGVCLVSSGNKTLRSSLAISFYSLFFKINMNA